MKNKLLNYDGHVRFCAIFLTSIFLLSASISRSANWYVNDMSPIGDIYTSAPGSNLNPGTTAAPFLTISQAVSIANPGDNIYIDAGVYNEDILVNKGVKIIGAGIAKSFVRGVKALLNPQYATFLVTGNNVIIENLTISRNGNNVVEWKDGLNTAGIGLHNANNVIIRNNKFTDNRTAIDVISSNGCSIHNNIIDFNRTGMFWHERCHNNIIKENFITNSWVIGVLWVSSGNNDAAGTIFYNNNISGSGYTHIENRNENSGLINFSYNWLGSCHPDTVSSVPRVEPDDSLIIPVQYGGSYIPPAASAVAVRGSTSKALNQIIYKPFLKSHVDMDINNGTGIMGFQGNFSTSSTNANAGPDVTLYLGYGPQCTTLNAIGPASYSYKWSNGANTQSITVCPVYTKKYTVTVTDNLGCLNQSSDNVTVCIIDVRCNKDKNDCNDKDDDKIMMCHKCKVKCVKEKDVEKHLEKGYCLGPCSLGKMTDDSEVELLISPNPFSSSFNLTYAGSSDQQAVIQIYDMTGKLVETEELTGNYNEVYMGHMLPKGLYSVVFTQGETRKIYRVIKTE